MDFIERWFHVSPDGGNGTLEWLYLAAAIVAAVVFIFRRRLTRFARRLTPR